RVLRALADWPLRWTLAPTLVARRDRAIRPAAAVFAQLAQGREGVDAGVVAVGPYDIQAVRPDERYVRQLILAGLEQRLHGKPPGKARLAFARGTRTGPAQHIKRNAMRDV